MALTKSCLPYGRTKTVICQGALPIFVFGGIQKFGGGVGTLSLDLIFRKLLNSRSSDSVARSLPYQDTAHRQRTLNATTLELEIQASVMESHPLFLTNIRSEITSICRHEPLTCPSVNLRRVTLIFHLNLSERFSKSQYWPFPNLCLPFYSWRTGFRTWKVHSQLNKHVD